jgi:mutator protein MutT
MARDRAAAILVHDDQLLVMYRMTSGRSYYVFPGGGIDAGETAQQAVVREIDEEASIAITVERLLYELYYDNGDTHYYFLCKYLAGEPRLRNDTNEYRETLRGDLHKPMWLGLSALPGVVLYPAEVKDELIRDVTAGFSDRTRALTADALF